MFVFINKHNTEYNSVIPIIQIIIKSMTNTESKASVNPRQQSKPNHTDYNKEQ